MQTRYLFGGLFALLGLASIISWFIENRYVRDHNIELIRNLRIRIQAWWVLVTVFCLALILGNVGSTILFGVVSFLALREFLTLTPTQKADHRSLFWAFFIITPIQYFLVGIKWYGLFTIFIPVYAFLLIPIRNALAGDSKDFLSRTAKIQWGLMICVYFVSYTPALMNLELRNYENKSAKLLFFFVFVVQISDVLQYIWGKSFGRHSIAPSISPSKTIEGFVGGILSTVLIGCCLYKITPFTRIEAALMTLIITLMGFLGGLVMSAIKRDRGVKDYGTIIPGHGGMMDRIDSLCFAAPVFYHLTRFFFS